MEHETNSSRLCASRTSLWCSVCGAKEYESCSPVGGLRFGSHDNHALGTVPRPQFQMEAVTPSLRDAPGNRPKWTPQRWAQ